VEGVDGFSTRPALSKYQLIGSIPALSSATVNPTAASQVFKFILNTPGELRRGFAGAEDASCNGTR